MLDATQTMCTAVAWETVVETAKVSGSISHNRIETNGIAKKLKSEDKKNASFAASAEKMWNLMHFGLRQNDIVHWLELAWEMSDNLLAGVRLSQADLWIRIRQNVINDLGEISERNINLDFRDFAVLIVLQVNHSTDLPIWKKAAESDPSQMFTK